jgi:hypothetical protein
MKQDKSLREIAAQLVITQGKKKGQYSSRGSADGRPRP